MSAVRNFGLSWALVVRLFADALMVNVSLIIGLGGRLLALMLGDHIANITHYRHLFSHYLDVYLYTGWLISLVCLILFALSGFYTHGRSYRSRYKVLIILQAVSLGYLISGFILYVLMGKGVQLIFGIEGMEFPRLAFLMAWFTTIGFVATSRLWSTIWRRMIHTESRDKNTFRYRKVHTILVIGGAGYIGSALLKRFLDKGFKVRLLDLLMYGPEPIAEMLNHPNLEIIKADFRQIDQVVEAMQGIDVVVHLGAIVGDPACALDEKLTIDVNVIATRMIAEIAKSNGVERFIFASTCSVYGVGEEILDEHSSLNPVSVYALSKLAAEQMLLRMASPDFAPVILRFGTIYGISGRIRFDLVVNLLTAKALREKKITIFGGSQWRPFLHVDDAARSVVRAIEVPLSAVSGQVLNVGSNEQNYQIQTIGEMIQGIIPSAELIDKGEDTDPRNYRVNFNKIRKVLNFTPEWKIEDGVHQVIQVLKEQAVDYNDSMYSNEKFLTDEGASQLMVHAQEWMEIYLKDVMQKIPG